MVRRTRPTSNNRPMDVPNRTTNELNALNAHIRARDEYETTDDEYEDTYRYRDDATPHHYRTGYTNTAPSNHNTPFLHDKYRNNVIEDTPRTGDCWPPVGECQSCGFQPQQRAGNRCIALARICDSCGITGHMERTCREASEPNPTQTAEHTDTGNSTSEITETKPPDDQPTHANPREVTYIPQDTTSGEQSNNEKRYDTGRAKSESHKPQHKQHSRSITQSEVQSVTITRRDDTSVEHLPEDTTLENTSDNANNSKRDPAPKSKPGTDRNDIRTYLWTRLSEAIDALESNSTHELSATELSLAERVSA
jgi:hypothetical protein